MKNFKKLIVFLTAILSLIVTAGCLQTPHELGSVAVGQAAPDFSLSDLKGNNVSLDQFEGKIVLLDFWASWCGPCRQTMPMFDAIQDDYHGKLVLLAINLQETKDVAREYILNENLNAQVLLDESGSVAGQYGVTGIPAQILIDQAGVIQYLNLKGVSPATGYRIRKEIDKLLKEGGSSASL